MLSFTCPKCGGNDLSCDIERSIKYTVIFENDDDISLEKVHGQEDEWDDDGSQESSWYCSDCYCEILNGTMDMLVEYLINQQNGAEA